MKLSRWKWFIAVMLVAAPSLLHGQPDASGASPSLAQPSPNDAGVLTLHEGTHLVVLDVVVTDKKGHTVSGLSKDDFKIYEDDHPQPVKFFEEHDPVDPALVAKEKAALAAQLPVNTFTSYEPFTGNPVNILLLNKLSLLPDYDVEPLRRQVLGVILDAPNETPFAIYQLDSKLRLVQPATDNRGLLIADVNQIWQQAEFGVPPQELGVSGEGKEKPKNADVVLAQRKVFTAAMQQLSSSFGPDMGRKTLFVFTGGIRCTLSSSWDCANGPSDLGPYLCGLIDGLEQARISMYRYYPDGQAVYGFGCGSWTGTLRDVFDTNAHYYTFYYTPTNQDWNGKYRKFRVTTRDINLRLIYRAGYYGREENAEARRDAKDTEAASSDVVAPGDAGVALRTTQAAISPAGPAEIAPEDSLNPMPVVFTVKVEPAAAPGTGPQATPPAPRNSESEADRLKGYRDYTLRFFVPAAGLSLVRELVAGRAAGQDPYSVGLEVTAVSYVRSHPADAKTIRVSAAFSGPADPRIAKGTITASMTIQVPEKGPRLLHLTVRDVYSGQSGRLDIPMEQIVLPKQ